jgi:hypothetical protein
MTDAEWAVHHVRVMVGDPETWRLNDEDVRALVLVLDELDRLRELSTNPEREVVGWTVRARTSTGYVYPPRPGLGGLFVASLKESHRFNKRSEAVDELEWWGHDAHVIKITRPRRKAEVGR